MEYKEDEFLMLSGLQHYKFCRRRWALIHIENQWAENLRTVDGGLMHENAHDKNFSETRGDIIVTRGMNVFSRNLGVSGECDVLEFHRTEHGDGISLEGREGLWGAFPVEYKRGKPHSQSGDELQLCAQAMCLEEMLCCDIPKGALYYGELRRRQQVVFTEELRRSVRESLDEMHDLFRCGRTPKVKPTKSCNACSMKDLCLPKLMRDSSVSGYLKQQLEEQL